MVPGRLADLAVLSVDYFAIPDEEIKHLESVQTVVGVLNGSPSHATPRGC